MDETQPLLRTISTRSDPDNDPERGTSTPPHKHGIVTFAHPSDPLNPQDWPLTYRWLIVLLLACQAFAVTFTCIGIVPIAHRVVLDLEGHENKQASVLFVTIWELGEAAGPLFIGPLSERYGRYPVFNVANVLFIGGIVMTALAGDVGVVIFARFLTGCAVASNVLGPAVVGDILPSESRGKGMSAVMLAPLLGGAVGPAIAGAIAETAGWRDVLWMAVALAGACELAFLTLFRETYKVPILRRKAAKLREETGDQSLRTEYDAEEKSWATELGKAAIRPVSVLMSSGILASMSVWGGLIFSFYYVMVTTLPDMLEYIYDFDAAMTGTAFLSFSKRATRLLSDLQTLTSHRHRLDLRNHLLQHLRRQNLRQSARAPRSREDLPGRPPSAHRRRSFLLAHHRHLLRPRPPTRMVVLAPAPGGRYHGLLRDPLHGPFAHIHHRRFRTVQCIGSDGGADDPVPDGDFLAFGDCSAD